MRHIPMQHLTTKAVPLGRGGVSLTHWSSVGALERLPKWLNLIPMVIQWFWLGFRNSSCTLPSTCNPAITAGGIVGEGKTEYLAIMGAHAKSHTAPAISFVNDFPVTLADVEAQMREAGLSFPLVAKPDIGWCGFGVRIVRSDAELAQYMLRFPVGERILLQHFVPHDGEAGLFYVRAPGEKRGRITGILLRSYPRVVGDGVHTIAELMARDERLARLGRDGKSEPCCDIAAVPGKGEIVRLTTIGSTRVGGLYRDATSIVTPELEDALDAIARDMTDFHIGRFDVRYESLGALRHGRGFTIIEVNGAGSEAVHAWEPKLTLRQAYAIVFAKQRTAFALGAAMRARGHKPISWAGLIKLHLKQQRLIRQYPPSN